jgi:hypothetical protein
MEYGADGLAHNAGEPATKKPRQARLAGGQWPAVIAVAPGQR